jgi:hypothetical protein
LLLKAIYVEEEDSSIATKEQAQKERAQSLKKRKTINQLPCSASKHHAFFLEIDPSFGFQATLRLEDAASTRS